MQTLKHYFLFLAFAGAVSSFAQTTTPPTPPKQESKTITIRSKSTAPEKMEVKVDGEKITVNGKPLSEFNNLDISVLMNDSSIKHSVHEILQGLRPLMNQRAISNQAPRAFLGVMTEKDEKGARIVSVEKGSAAEKAGLEKGDIITQVNQELMDSPESLANNIGKLKPADKAMIHYLRNGKKGHVELVLGKTPVNEEREIVISNGKQLPNQFFPSLPEWKGRFNEIPKLEGFLNTPQRPKIGLEISDIAEGKGVIVKKVIPESPAAKSGLQQDDLVTELNGKLIEGVDQAKEILRNLKEGEMLKLTYSRKGKTHIAELKMPKRIKTAEL